MMRPLYMALSLAVLGLAGCGSEESRIPLVPVTGTISFNSKPLAGAQVVYFPDAKNRYNTPGKDVSGAEGNYSMFFKDRLGVSPGKYKVTVTVPEAAETGEKIPDDFKDDPLMYRIVKQSGEANAESTKKKADAQSTKKKPTVITKNQFEAEVGDDGGVFDFDVKGDPDLAAKK